MNKKLHVSVGGQALAALTASLVLAGFTLGIGTPSRRFGYNFQPFLPRDDAQAIADIFKSSTSPFFGLGGRPDRMDTVYIKEMAKRFAIPRWTDVSIFGYPRHQHRFLVHGGLNKDGIPIIALYESDGDAKNFLGRGTAEAEGAKSLSAGEIYRTLGSPEVPKVSGRPAVKGVIPVGVGQ